MGSLPVAVLLAAPLAGSLPKLAHAQTVFPLTAWGYMSGTEDVNDFDSNVRPNGRVGAATWTDLNGNFWLFGGLGLDSNGNGGELNDLWEYSVSNNTWTLMSNAATITLPGSGEAVCNAGNYTAGSYVVGGRALPATWVDRSGNLWLFGGFGCISGSTTAATLGDLWMYNIASGQWTFEGGSQVIDSSGIYPPQQFVPSATFYPGTRYRAIAWTGSDGSFWLFGGNGYDSGGNAGLLNDLWKFDPATSEWSWVAGGLTNGQPGSYGAAGQPAPANVPGSRESAASTTDSNGNFWLFGGMGCSNSCAQETNLNDLWMFNPSTMQWTWEAGTQSQNQQGSADFLFVTASSNDPGSREFSSLWTDAGNNLWLFGGDGLDTGASSGDLNDFWEFDVFSREWTFMGGSPTLAGAKTPAYGTKGTPDLANIPGGRYGYATWNTVDNNLWIFGGIGFNSTSTGFLDDLWEAILPTPTPAFSLAPGTYQGPQTLTMTDGLSGAPVYYSTDGSYPGHSATPYSGPITIANSEFVQAIGTPGNLSWSLTRQAQYIVVPQTAITWEPPAAVTYGAPLSSVQLDASTGMPGIYAYTPTAGTILQAGNNVLSVTFTPSNPAAAGFLAATTNVTLAVNPAMPVITWATPAAIPSGTALGNGQLDATSTVPGAFAYTPAAGAVLSAGTQTISVTFTPADTKDYSTATASVSLTVLPVIAPSFTISGSPTGQTVYSGSSTDFIITVTPVNGAFSSAVALSVSGLPSGAKGAFSQSSLTPGASAVTSILTVSVASSTASNQGPASPLEGAPRALAPLMALLLLLPLRRVRKAARKMLLPLVLAVSLGATISLSACGSGNSTNSTTTTTTAPSQTTSVLTVTGTSGSSTQTAQLVLTVE